MTRNKDGSIRKRGSGRTKGATSLVSVRFGDLKPFLGEDSQIIVGRKFLEAIGFLRSEPKVISQVEKETARIDLSIIDFSK